MTVHVTSSVPIRSLTPLLSHRGGCQYRTSATAARASNLPALMSPLSRSRSSSSKRRWPPCMAAVTGNPCQLRKILSHSRSSSTVKTYPAVGSSFPAGGTGYGDDVINRLVGLMRRRPWLVSGVSALLGLVVVDGARRSGPSGNLRTWPAGVVIGVVIYA